MKQKFITVTLLILVQHHQLISQQNYYDVNSGNGKGLRFWNGSNSYKISMGNSSEYKYGPVTDYSIKSSMSNTSGRGWTWGVSGQTPVAALSIGGKLQLANSIVASGELETTKSNYTKFQLARDEWGGSHAILFNAYKIYAPGDLMTTGNTRYANNEGSYDGGAGMIHFLGNGGRMDFLISPKSTGQDQNISWGGPKMTIKRNGNVGIGTSTTYTDYKLTAYNSGSGIIAGIIGESFAESIFSEGWGVVGKAESGTSVGVKGEAISNSSNGAAYGIIGDASGPSGSTVAAGFFYRSIYYTGSIHKSSDSRLKRNIESISHGLNVIEKLRPTKYELLDIKKNTTYDKLQTGLIAEEVNEILPHLVDEFVMPNNDSVMTSDPKKYLSIDYTQLIPYLVCAIQEQQSAIEALTAELNTLKKSLTNEGIGSQSPVIVSLIPNPASEAVEITLKNLDNSRETSLIIYDINGFEIIRKKVNDNIHILDVSNILEGIYFIGLIQNEVLVDVKRIIIKG